MTFERRTRINPGYDCRVTCTHSPARPGRDWVDGHGVRDAKQPQECEYLGRCYHYGNWYLLADELVKEHFVHGVQTIEESQPKLWTALETFLLLQTTHIEVARNKTGDLGWRQCAVCGGKGVTPTGHL